MRTPQAPEGLGPDPTQAFLLDSASDLMQAVSRFIIMFPRRLSLCLEQTVILQCLAGPVVFFKCSQSRVTLLGRCSWDSLNHLSFLCSESSFGF